MEMKPESKDQKKFIDYVLKLLKKQKIVYVRDIYNSDNTPKDVRTYLYSGNLSGKLSHMYAYNNGLRVMRTSLGNLKKEHVIAFLVKDEEYVTDLLLKHEILIKDYEEKQKELKEIESQICQLTK